MYDFSIFIWKWYILAIYLLRIIIDNVMAKKKPQALKFHPKLEEDLKFIAGMKGLSYNGYVERILSSHVLVQIRAIRSYAESGVSDSGSIGRSG